MNLGIAGRWALVCAASKGLGKACAQALVSEGVNVVITVRGEQVLNGTASQLRVLNPAVTVIAVAGDISTPAGRSAALAVHEHFDILINNAGGPPAGNFREWNRDTWLKALDANMLTPIELIKATVDGMAARGFGRKPIENLGLSNGARSGLTGFIAGLARQDNIASRNVTINNLQPGSFDTDRLRGNLVAAAEESGQDSEAFLAECRSEIPAKRFGSPEEFGALCAFVCSSHAGYLTGQNLLIDGGAIRSSQ
ncbi:3-oxoacyl-[acyl-carrier protein] reductase [Pseudomonas frederiksbergensis]|jgi:3-oxoacyl-[acyl-carrier protein] reductase|uniref:SDR family oxidoreductase n=1 Tax=Pseudomonas frederiksbergensis TaxID=104087 RepID=UPI003D25D617